jgi:hypothetical protein
MCNTINDSSAQSCSYCGYIFENVAPVDAGSFPSQRDAAPTNVLSQPDATASPSYSTTAQSGLVPVFVVKSSWRDRNHLPSLIFGIIITAVYIVLYLPFYASANYNIGSFIFLIFPFLFILPAFTSNRTFEFYENSLTIRGIGSVKEIPYSEISAVSTVRGRTFIQLKNSWRAIRLQGTIKSNTAGQDPYEWLSNKIKAENPPEAPSDTSAQDSTPQ